MVWNSLEDLLCRGFAESISKAITQVLDEIVVFSSLENVKLFGNLIIEFVGVHFFFNIC